MTTPHEPLVFSDPNEMSFIPEARPHQYVKHHTCQNCVHFRGEQRCTPIENSRNYDWELKLYCVEPKAAKGRMLVVPSMTHVCDDFQEILSEPDLKDWKLRKLERAKEREKSIFSKIYDRLMSKIRGVTAEETKA